MPFTPDMRRRVDQIRDYLYGGGYPDPLTNAEQLSFLFFFCMIEVIDAASMRQAKATKLFHSPLMFAISSCRRRKISADLDGSLSCGRRRARQEARSLKRRLIIL